MCHSKISFSMYYISFPCSNNSLKEFLGLKQLKSSDQELHEQAV